MNTLGDLKTHDQIINHLGIPKDFSVGGWVYVLENPVMPGVYKIGATRNHPEQRAKELSSSTGVPTPFIVESAYYADDPFTSESAIHHSLKEYRVDKSREFFRCDLKKIHLECKRHCIAEFGGSTEGLAIDYSVISFERLENIDLESILDEVGLEIIGCKLAIVDRLIRIGADFIKQQNRSLSTSTVFKDGVMYQIKDIEWQNSEKSFDPVLYINSFKGDEDK